MGWDKTEHERKDTAEQFLKEAELRGSFFETPHFFPAGHPVNSCTGRAGKRSKLLSESWFQLRKLFLAR